MTEAEAIEKLKPLDGNGDTEADHVNADRIIMDFLQSNGYGALADQYRHNCTNYWYA